MRVNILDPGLLDRSGHHLEYDLGIARVLNDLGHEVRLYPHVRIGREAREAVPASVRLEPVFRVSPYSDPEKIDPVSGELRVFLDGATMLAADLGRVAAADLWIWPSLFAPQLYASALAKPGVPVSGCLHIEPTYRAPNGRMWWGYAFLAAREAGLGLNIGANVPGLVQAYAPLAGGARISLFPIASDGAPGPLPRTELRTIGFFGYQRKEKGLDVLAGLVPRLLREGYHVVLQDSGSAVRAVPGQRLAVLGYLPRLADEVAKCDLVVLPYDPDAYRAKGSGIAWDAIASGVPITGPAGTYVGALVASTGAGTTFTTADEDGVHRAILEARAGYGHIAAAAHEASRTWRDAHGMRHFVTALLGAQVSPA